ncbi:hypothetical protein DXG01_013719 [Tephrocybe rancida]|nr:hypothetical protein DXG01_013719 [Tephrocybe rancida]
MASAKEKSVPDFEKDAKIFSSSDDGFVSGDDFVARQIAQEGGLDVRTYSVLGIVPGIILTICVAVICLYTSLVLWQYCLKYPELRDICDIGQKLFGGSVTAYNVTCAFFILNNLFTQALHVLVGAEVLNTLSNSSQCTIVFAVVSGCICFFFTLPRTLSQMSYIAFFSAGTMGIAISLTMIFSGVQSHPAGYIPGDEPIVTAVSIVGTTFVQGMSAFLNITFTLVGQSAVPSFIAEMKNPKDFPKALYVVTIAQIIMLSLCGAVVYHFVGNQYVTAPAVGSLQPILKKFAFSFAIPTTFFLGSLYASVTARFVFFRIFKNTKHLNSNSIIAWTSWVTIIAVSWIIAFVLAQVVPFFSDLLSLMCALFDGWFGFIFWAMAYLHLNPSPMRWNGVWKSVETLLNYFFIALGVFILVAGLYTAVQSIMDSYAANLISGVFSCASTAL